MSHVGITLPATMRLFARQDGRYYAIYPPAKDLLGDEVIVTFHGSTRSRLGGVHTYPSGATSIEQLIQVRHRHGYVELAAGESGQATCLANAKEGL